MLVSRSVHIKIDSGYLQYNCYPGYTTLSCGMKLDAFGYSHWIPFGTRIWSKKKHVSKENATRTSNLGVGKPMEALQYTKIDLAELCRAKFAIPHPRIIPQIALTIPPTLNLGTLPSLGSLKYNSISYFVVENDWRFNRPSAKQKPAEINVATSDSGNGHRNRYQAL